MSYNNDEDILITKRPGKKNILQKYFRQKHFRQKHFRQKKTVKLLQALIFFIDITFIVKQPMLITFIVKQPILITWSLLLLQFYRQTILSQSILRWVAIVLNGFYASEVILYLLHK